MILKMKYKVEYQNIKRKMNRTIWLVIKHHKHLLLLIKITGELCKVIGHKFQPVLEQQQEKVSQHQLEILIK